MSPPNNRPCLAIAHEGDDIEGELVEVTEISGRRDLTLIRYSQVS